MKAALAAFVLRLLGWRICGELPTLKKAVLIVAPHTSNWDFPLGVLARAVVKRKISFIGKATLFKPPFGFLFRWLGGFPVSRDKKEDTVAFVVSLFERHEDFLFALSPEGTRAYTPKLRSGFYQIALQAKVPIVMVGFDFERKEIQLQQPFMPTGDFKADMNQILAYFKTVKGLHPENGIVHQTVD
jgi:1-acyl-sn-glycerol-3-phosphate acyltransferase